MSAIRRRSPQLTFFSFLRNRGVFGGLAPAQYPPSPYSPSVAPLPLHILLASLLAVTASAANPPGAYAQDPKPAPADEAKTVWDYLAQRYDKDGDKKISKAEYSRGEDAFKRLDRDGNGFIEAADTASAGGGRGRGERGERGERGQRGQRGQRGEGRERGGERPTAPREGEMAPDFELETLYPTKPETDESKAAEARSEKAEQEAKPEYESTKLSSFKGKRPVALIFGSYT